ncbi:MAG: ADP-ribose pyrophosphatase [Pyrinomonadaceae bacterium]|nr:ADP-ribose pyrophosphatase [Pyrinomonadaceae bacterium]
MSGDAEELNDGDAAAARGLFANDDTHDLSWRRRSSEIIADCRVFQVRRDVSISPHRGSEHNFFVLESSDWINIIPLTTDNEVVMIEQYRHGSEEVTLEIPGGMVDAGELPRDAATREMLEETGYAATGDVISLGKVRPNPAIHNNWIHTFIARDVSLRQKPVIESTEHTVVRLVPLADVPQFIADGTINHALVVVGFHWLALHQAGLAPVV